MRVYLANTASSWLSWRLAYIRTSKGTGKCPYLSLPKMLACRTIEVKRLNGLIRTLKRKPQMAKDYMECMEKIITKGHASPVPIGEVTRPLQSGLVWHLPHFRVYHLKKPTQIRVVFDSSAKYEGVSLNGELLPGPDLMNSLLGVLFRFRMETTAVMCDGNNSCHV